MRKLCLPEGLHLGLTGQAGPGWSDRSENSNPSSELYFDMRFVRILTSNEYRPLHHINIKGYGRLRHIQSNQSTIHLLFTLILFQPLHAVRLLISTTRDGVLRLAGQSRTRLATFTPRRGPSRARVSTAFASLLVN